MSILTNSLLIKELIEFGLSEKEAKVYLALLELEVAAVSEVSKTANINRSSTYVVLESLKKKGLVSFSKDKKIQKYMAVSPDLLLRKAEDKAKKTEEIKNKISNIIPELKALYKDIKQKPKVRIFEGEQGLINVLEETLNNKEKIIRTCSSTENLLKILPNYLPQYIQKRINLGIKLYGIYPDNKTEKKLDTSMLKFDRSILLPKEKYKFPVEIGIFDNKIGYISSDKRGFAIIIENKEIANVMKNVFDLAFEEAKRLSKNSSKKKK